MISIAVYRLMISRLASFHLILLSLVGIMAVGRIAHPVSQEKESKIKASSATRGPLKASKPLEIKFEGGAQRYSAVFESARLNLDRELRDALRQKNRKGMDLIELTISLAGPGDRSGLALVAKNFVPESTGPWDKQDVLSFLASGDGPVYLNLSLLQSMIQAMTSYRNQILGRPGEVPPSIETWSVTFEKNNGESLRFQGGFEGEKSMIHPTVLIHSKKLQTPLEIKADGENVAEALARGTFPLPPLRILGQFSSTKLVMEFFGKE